jgi:hypothetical protein
MSPSKTAPGYQVKAANGVKLLVPSGEGESARKPLTYGMLREGMLSPRNPVFINLLEHPLFFG